jgi:hypothetical protein
MKNTQGIEHSKENQEERDHILKNKLVYLLHPKT